MIDKTQLYLVANESKSPVTVNTRMGSIFIDGASEDAPAVIPMSLDDIIYINSTSNAFKIGLLFFAEKEYEEELYDAIQLYNWRDIMHTEDIADIILNPTVEKLQKVLDITNQQYFERIRGVYTSLMNHGYDISNKVTDVIKGRYLELMKRISTSRIELVPKETKDKKAESEIDELKAQIAELQKLIAGKTANDTAEKKEEPKPKTAKKTTAKTGTAKTQ